jgi:hypothetical protein
MLAVPELTVTLHRELIIGLVTRLRVLLFRTAASRTTGGLAVTSG